MEGHKVTVGEVSLGTKVFAEAFYWDRAVELAGEILGVTLVGAQLEHSPEASQVVGSGASSMGRELERGRRERSIEATGRGVRKEGKRDE